MNLTNNFIKVTETYRLLLRDAFAEISDINESGNKLLAMLIRSPYSKKAYDAAVKYAILHGFDQLISRILAFEFGVRRAEFFNLICRVKISRYELVWRFIEQCCLMGFPEIWRNLVSLYSREEVPNSIRNAAAWWEFTYSDCANWHSLSDTKFIERRRSILLNPLRNREKIRVGFMSTKFATNMLSSQNSFLSLITKGRKDHHEVHVISLRTFSDFLQRPYVEAADLFHNIGHLSVAEQIDYIEKINLDFIIDLNGNFDLVLGLSTPTSVSPFGTLSLCNNYYDFVMLPRDFWPEKSWTKSVLIDGGCKYMIPLPRQQSVDVTQSLPSIKNNYVTFGIFSRLSKWSTAYFNAIADILLKIPDAKLKVSFIQADASTTWIIEKELASRNVNPSRIEFLAKTDPKTHALKYNDIDVVLDSFPQGGGFTAIEALWMGVPLIVLDSINERWRNFAPNLLEMAGLSTLVVRTQGQYVDRALEISRDLKFRSELKQQCRRRLSECGALDEGKAHSEAFYRVIDSIMYGEAVSSPIMGSD